MILITGAFGQLGRILTEQLLQANEKLLLVDRNLHDKPLVHLPTVTLEEGDLSDVKFCNYLFQKYSIETIFNFATNSFVEREFQINLKQRCNILDNIIHVIESNNQKDKIWILHPLSSEIFGIPKEVPQNEKTERLPINTYGLQKSLEEIKCNFLRDNGYTIYNPILNNAESKFRSEFFFTKKIISTLKKISYGEKFECVEFYNAYSSRDFGYAGDYIKNFIIAAKEKKNSIELLGSGINMKIIDFIKKALDVLEISTVVKSNKNGLIEFYHNGKIILSEKARSTTDERRVFVASSKNLSSESVKIRGGRELIKILVNE